MERQISAYLGGNSYPGRGILMGLAPDGKRAFLAYFIMGRSENSRNRVFEELSNGLVTRPADPSAVEDPSLIIYRPVWHRDRVTVVTNGDQTDTIREHLERGETFEAALRTRTFEPDPPHNTPRISGILQQGDEAFSYTLAIVKAAGGKPVRFFYEYPCLRPGVGHLIHTYAGDGEALPPFAGEPVELELPATLEALDQTVWDALDKENRIALFVRAVGLDGEEETRRYNRFRAK